MTGVVVVVPEIVRLAPFTTPVLPAVVLFCTARVQLPAAGLPLKFVRGSLLLNGPRPASAGQKELYVDEPLSSKVMLTSVALAVPEQLRSSSRVRVPSGLNKYKFRSDTGA